MNLFELDLLTALITCSVLIFIYAGTLYKVYMGSRYPTIINIASLLLAANVMYLVKWLGFHELIIGGKDNPDDKDTLFAWACVLAIGQSIGDLCFCVGQWLLAVYYLNIGTNMPKVLINRQGGQAQITDYNPARRYGVAVNTLIPLTLLGFSVGYYFKEINNDEDGSFVAIATFSLTAAESLSEIVSGTILVWSVFCIRSYLKST